MHSLDFALLLLLVTLLSCSSFVAALPPTGGSGGQSFELLTPWYKIRINNKTNATLSSEYVRADQRHIDFFLSDAGKTARATQTSRGNVPVWERSAASDHDDRIVWSVLMDNFSMPFFEHQLRHHGSNDEQHNNNMNGAATQRTVARAVTFLISSNGFITPSLSGYLCSDYFCSDYYFPNERRQRTVDVEQDIVPQVSILSYDLDPRHSSSPHPISVFYAGKCVDDLDPDNGEHFTKTAHDCDSIVVDFDQIPEYGYNISSPLLSAQAQLFRNGTVIVRYLHMLRISDEPWWHVNGQVDKSHPSCGLLNHNNEQIANASEYCRDANRFHGGTPLYNEFVFTPRDLDEDKWRAMQPPYPGKPCDERLSCTECISGSSGGCTWCEGVLPQSSDSTVESGRCVLNEMADGVCGAFPELMLTTANMTATTASAASLTPEGAAARCKNQQFDYARLQQPLRSVWYNSERGLTMPEWRFGAWMNESPQGFTAGASTAWSSSSSTSVSFNPQRNNIGPTTMLPPWNSDTDISLGHIYGRGVTHSVEHIIASAPGILGRYLLPSAWWLHTPEAALDGNQNNLLKCSLGSSANSWEAIISCRQLEVGGGSAVYSPLRINIFNPIGFLTPRNVSVVEVPGIEFSDLANPPHKFCIRRRCGDAPALRAALSPICSSDSSYRCDAFTLITWRGDVLPAENGTFTFTLGVAVAEFGHIIASIDTKSPLLTQTATVLPKHVQHFYIDYPGGRYSAPMRRWTGSGVSIALAPVTTCPSCPIGTRCNAETGTCGCAPQFDPASMCTRCRGGFVTRNIINQDDNGRTTFKRCVPCPHCLNGGHCDNTTGTCKCLPGFDGNLCDVACPPETHPGYRTFTTTDGAPVDDRLLDDKLRTAKAACLLSPRNTWLCSQCVVMPEPNQPKPPKVTPFWVYLIGWTVVFAAIFTCLWFLCKKWAERLGSGGDSSGYSREELRRIRRRRRRRMQRAMRRSQQQQGGNGNGNNGHGSSNDDDDDDDDFSGTDSQEDDDEDRFSQGDERDGDDDQEMDDLLGAAAAHLPIASSGNAATSSRQRNSQRNNRHSAIEAHLRSVPPQMRERILEQLLESSRGTDMESRWQQRLDESRRNRQRQSNPLGISIDVSPPRRRQSGGGGQQQQPQEQPAPQAQSHQLQSNVAPGRSGLSSSDDDNDDTERERRAQPQRQEPEEHQQPPQPVPTQEQEDALLQPVRIAMSAADFPAAVPRSLNQLNDDDDDNDEQHEQQQARTSNNNNRPARATVVVTANPLTDPVRPGETIVKGTVIGLDDL